jgi:type I restriction enzyme S subunit
MASLEVPWKTKTLSELFSIEHESISPATFPSELFGHYSIPAWDRLGAAVLEPGSSIGSTKSLITKRTILVSKLNPRKPRVVLVDGSPRGRTCASTEFIPYVPRSEEADLRFYWRFFESREFQRRLEQIATGTTNSHVRARPSETLTWDVPLPPHAEQGLVANILDTLDQAIQLTEQLIAKLQQMKHGLLHDLLTRGIDDNGEVRDPERQPELFKRGPLGALPAAWRVATLGDLVRECGGFIQTGPFGSQLHAYEFVTEGVPVVMPQDIDGDRFTETRISRISERRAADLARHRLRRNDTVFARRGDLSRCAPVSASEEGWLCGTGCLLVRIPQSGLAGEWLAAVYRHDSGQRQVLARAVGSTMVNLNTTILASLTIPIPPAREQCNVIKRVNELTSRTFSEEDLLRKLQVIKSGLSDDLLTGRVRVNKLLEGNAG